MCGIVGLFLKDPKLEPKLGAMLTDMLITLTDRGPDSAGIAIYVRPQKGRAKLTVQSSQPESDFKGLDVALAKAIGGEVSVELKDSHAVFDVPHAKLDGARTAIAQLRPGLKVMSAGQQRGLDVEHIAAGFGPG